MSRPARKEDPGELFPWAELAAAGIGLWPQISAGACGAEGLPRFGYDPDVPLDKTITAFQRHFRPAKTRRPVGRGMRPACWPACWRFCRRPDYNRRMEPARRPDFRSRTRRKAR